MMYLKDRVCVDASSSCNELLTKMSSENPSFTDFNLQQQQQKWEEDTIISPSFRGFNQASESEYLLLSNRNNQTKILNHQEDGQNNEETLETNEVQDWDPRAMLNNLSFLEQKIHHLQDLVHLFVGRKGHALGGQDRLVTQQQQLLITADLTSVIVQLISTAGSLLPSVKQILCTGTPNGQFGQLGQLGALLFPSVVGMNCSPQPQHGDGSGSKAVQPQQAAGSKVSDQSNQMDVTGNCGTEQNHSIEDHEIKEEEDADEGDNLPPGSYDILQLEKEEILAPHTHFCTKCGKGFKRDANLRMHMRGHGDEYKTLAALAKPNKESSSDPVIIKRYSCPFAGCKRNKDHKKFQPLKSILCVKNHYKRTHCDKSYTCSRCNTKKFSVMADLKTHEKHCGKDKWLCSCGTTFSRKDKLFGHITLFQGHTPAIHLEETKGLVVSSDKVDGKETPKNVGTINFSFGSNAANGSGAQNVMEVNEDSDDPATYFSPLNFDTCNFGGFHELPRSPYDDSDSSFSFLLSGSCNYSQKTGGVSPSTNLQ